ILSVSMTSSADGFAVGNAGLILRWNGASWSQLVSPTGSTLYSVSMFSSDLGYAAGQSGIVLKWDGISWASETMQSNQNLFSIDIFCPSAGWAVGAGATLHQLNDYYLDGGQFFSRIFDGESPSTDWYSLQWEEINFSDTDLTLATRTGNTPVPDG